MLMSAAIAGIRASFSCQSVNTSTLASWVEQKEDLILLDVREEGEFEVSRISDSAIHIVPGTPASSVISQIKDIHGDHLEAKKIICYCSLGYRSGQMADSLIESNLLSKEQVYNLEGSIFKWANENRPLVGSDTVHPYNNTFGLLLDSKKRYS